MRRHRKLLISALLLATTGAVAWFLYHRTSEPPLATRLLPEGDVLIYANLKPVHLWEMSKSAPVQFEGEYQSFIAATGIQFERDLDEVAMSRRDTADGRDTESSEIFVGRFDLQKLKSYLEKVSAQRDGYHDAIIYTIPHEGHIVRVCVLDSSHVAVTNMASPDPIHEMIDGWRKPGNGPSLLRNYHSQVPLASLGWVIVRIPANSKSPQLPTGWSFDFLEGTITVASFRYQGDLLLRADVIAATESDAKRVVDAAGSFLAMYRAVTESVGTRGSDADVKTAIDSLQMQQEKNVAVFTATIPQKMLKKLVSQAQSEVSSPAPPASPVPTRNGKVRSR